LNCPLAPPNSLQEVKDMDMETKNCSSSSMSDFILLGISSNPHLQKPLFAVFLIMYLVTLVGNVLIILAIHSDARLHTPMYFFLSNLSFMDICFTTAIVPKMLVTLLSETKSISYVGCLVQMSFFMAFGNTDSYLLASMAIDRLVAICNPLHYNVAMKPWHLTPMLNPFIYSLRNKDMKRGFRKIRDRIHS
uniref:G-protein coupled receptors family 1 profile domain-containing protein n=1 Tax=Sus scrofa TaxID=9823 RepID=A0A8D1AZR6_PIG